MKQIYDNKDIGETIDKSFDAGIKEGYRRCREQMMKEAVEGDIEGNWREQEDAPYELYATSDELDSTKYKIGDKVKLIILKEDE